jgi:hypothetical protein
MRDGYSGEGVQDVGTWMSLGRRPEGEEIAVTDLSAFRSTFGPGGEIAERPLVMLRGAKPLVFGVGYISAHVAELMAL